MIINFTFNEDIKTHILKDIQDKRRFLWNEEDISDLQHEDVRELMLLHCDLTTLRLIKVKPRHVYTSQEIDNALNGQHGVVLQKIIDSLLAGTSVNERLSREITKIDYQDKLLFDWGINHLHLGTNIIDYNTRKHGDKAKGLIEGGNNLLFLYLKEDSAYLIDIKDHGSFEDTDLLEIMNREWPKVLNLLKDDNILGLSVNFSAADIKELRKNNINPLIMLSNGSVSAGTHGISLNSTSISSTEQVNAFMKELDHIKAHITANANEIVHKIGLLTSSAVNTVEIGIKFNNDDKYEIYEKVSGLNLNDYLFEEE